ncbi:MAG: hypothetical protein PHD43_14810, partial [Methylococcales bacterium]|nr:hypothetical protein [Methylococcales bacterium]
GFDVRQANGDFRLSQTIRRSIINPGYVSKFQGMVHKISASLFMRRRYKNSLASVDNSSCWY